MGLPESAGSAHPHLGNPCGAQGALCYLLSSSTPEMVTLGRGCHSSSSKSNAVSQVQAKFISRSNPYTPSISINRTRAGKGQEKFKIA